MSSPQEIVAAWTARCLTSPERIARIDGRFTFVVKGAGVWAVHCKEPVEIKEYKSLEDAPKSDCQIVISSEDFVALAEKRLNPQAAWITGRIALSGNVSLALKLHELIG